MFKPNYSINDTLASMLINIESLKNSIDHAPFTTSMLASLRTTARLKSTHYSTKIEGNLLSLQQIDSIIKKGGTIVGREREQHEILGYYAALDQVDKFAKKRQPITEQMLQNLHATILGGGKKNLKPTPYRDGQNVIRDGATGSIVYLPPEAQDVPQLMTDLVEWLNFAEKNKIPVPLQAALAHYQFVTIHPYYDGNGRTARILATLILHSRGYGLKGIYSLEEYYAQDLPAYYKALSVGPSHNYYMGRAEADLTKWLLYFCAGMQQSFEHIQHQTQEVLSKHKDLSDILVTLDARQRAILTLFEKNDIITSRDIQNFFNLNPRTARHLCQEWVKDNFLVIVDSSKRKRTYALSQSFRQFV